MKTQHTRSEFFKNQVNKKVKRVGKTCKWASFSKIFKWELSMQNEKIYKALAKRESKKLKNGYLKAF